MKNENADLTDNGIRLIFQTAKYVPAALSRFGMQQPGAGFKIKPFEFALFDKNTGI